MSNLTVQQQQNLSVISSTLKSPDIYTKIQEMLGRKPDSYITSVMQVLESNAMLANVLEYGKHGQPPRPILKPAKAASRKPCVEAMEAAMKKELGIT